MKKNLAKICLNMVLGRENENIRASAEEIVLSEIVIISN